MYTSRNRVDIIQNDRVIGFVTLSDDEWHKVNTIDYIEVDSKMHLAAEFDVHGQYVCKELAHLVSIMRPNTKQPCGAFHTPEVHCYVCQSKMTVRP